MAIMGLEEFAGHLEATGDYRVLRRIKPREVIMPDDGGSHLTGIILDTETTGLDHRADEIIELGMIKFEFDTAGQIFRVVDEFQGFREPLLPITPEITKITGITMDMVSGQSIDPDKVEAFISDTVIVIAHNAAFDRPFCEKPWKGFAGKSWACSMSEIDWQAQGFEGQMLGYILAGCGLFHDGHRAVEDCRALLEILARPLPSGALTLKQLLDRARLATVRIWAEGAPFSKKDILKARDYRWSDGSDGGRKSWWRDVPETAFADEMAFLRGIYGREPGTPTKRLTAFDRFSARTE